jgi:hypothetical protein
MLDIKYKTGERSAITIIERARISSITIIIVKNNKL